MEGDFAIKGNKKEGVNFGRFVVIYILCFVNGALKLHFDIIFA